MLLLVTTILCGSGIFIVTNNSNSLNRVTELREIPKSSPSAPEQAVIEYCVFSKADKLAEVENQLTPLPDSYLTYILSEKDVPMKSRTSITHNDGTKYILTTENLIKGYRKTFQEITYKELKGYFPSTIRFWNLEIREIVDKKIKDDIALVHVKLQDADKKTYENFFHSELYFYLYNENGKWKIFKIDERFTKGDFPE